MSMVPEITPSSVTNNGRLVDPDQAVATSRRFFSGLAKVVCSAPSEIHGDVVNKIKPKRRVFHRSSKQFSMNRYHLILSNANMASSSHRFSALTSPISRRDNAEPMSQRRT